METREASIRTGDELNRLYCERRLVFVVPDQATLPAKVPVSQLLADLPAADRQRAVMRWNLLCSVDKALAAAPRTEAALSAALESASLAAGFERPVSLASYRRWRSLYQAEDDVIALAGRFHSRGRKSVDEEVADIVRIALGQAVEQAKQPQVPGATRPTIKSIRARVDKEIEAQNLCRAHAGDELLRPMGRTTFYDLYAKLPAWERDVVRYGLAKARSMYRGIWGHDRPELPLDLGEYDETRVPIFLYDEDSGVPLGRPWLNWIVDVASTIPTGIYLGFEPPGDLSVAATLRHACLPKTYVADEYPDIKNPYLGHGIYRNITFDNELAAHSASIKTLATDLQFDFQWAPSHTPWFKPAVEGMFSTLNRVLLEQLPGFVLGRNLDQRDYNPIKNGCLGLRHFLYIFHKWLIDVYCQTPSSGTSYRRPRSGRRAWLDGSRT